MPFFDLPLDKLRTYKAPATEPKDFDAFWRRTLRESAAFDLSPRFDRVLDSIYQSVDVYDVTFGGYLGQPIKGWFIEPAGNKARLPCVVKYIGYGGGRSLPIDHLEMAVAGVSMLVMDTRGQGATWAPGDTPDVAPLAARTGPQVPGFMTRGIENPDDHYYRRVFTDAARAIDAALSHPRVDAKRIAVTGLSQGGGITLAAAGLAGKRVKLCMPDVPFLCHYERACTIVDTFPYNEVANYLKTHRGKVEQVYQTLAYFDGMNFAPRITARCLFSVGLMDTVCPPSTVYAAYNRVKAPKEIRNWEYNNHEGGGVFQVAQRLQFVVKWL